MMNLQQAGAGRLFETGADIDQLREMIGFAPVADELRVKAWTRAMPAGVFYSTRTRDSEGAALRYPVPAVASIQRPPRLPLVGLYEARRGPPAQGAAWTAQDNPRCSNSVSPAARRGGVDVERCNIAGSGW